MQAKHKWRIDQIQIIINDINICHLSLLTNESIHAKMLLILYGAGNI